MCLSLRNSSRENDAGAREPRRRNCAVTRPGRRPWLTGRVSSVCKTSIRMLPRCVCRCGRHRRARMKSRGSCGAASRFELQRQGIPCRAYNALNWQTLLCPCRKRPARFGELGQGGLNMSRLPTKSEPDAASVRHAARGASPSGTRVVHRALSSRIARKMMQRYRKAARKTLTSEWSSATGTWWRGS